MRCNAEFTGAVLLDRVCGLDRSSGDRDQTDFTPSDANNWRSQGRCLSIRGRSAPCTGELEIHRCLASVVDLKFLPVWSEHTGIVPAGLATGHSIRNKPDFTAAWLIRRACWPRVFAEVPTSARRVRLLVGAPNQRLPERFRGGAERLVDTVHQTGAHHRLALRTELAGRNSDQAE
jgi:hypothetical protein